MHCSLRNMPACTRVCWFGPGGSSSRLPRIASIAGVDTCQPPPCASPGERSENKAVGQFSIHLTGSGVLCEPSWIPHGDTCRLYLAVMKVDVHYREPLKPRRPLFKVTAGFFFSLSLSLSLSLSCRLDHSFSNSDEMKQTKCIFKVR
jgi:hypothetical protein